MLQAKAVARRLRSSLPTASWKGVTDPRDRRGRRYRLDGLLMLLVLGFMSACRALRDVEQLGKEMRHRRTFRLGSGPSDTTLDRVVRGVCPVELEHVLIAQAQGMIRSKQVPNLPEIGLSLVAIDGKRFGTSSEASHPASRAIHSEEFGFQVHALRAVHVSSAVKPVLGQRVVDLGDGEVNTLWPFVEELLANYGGFVECVSFDAGMTGYLNATRLESAGVFYIAALKANCRKALFCAKRDLGEGEADPKSGWVAQTVTVEGTKRTVRRFSRAESRMQNVDWQGVSRQVWRVQKRVEERDGRVTVEDRYFLTNLPWERLKPSQCLAAVRAHWGIENDCNWTLDVKLLEDTVTWVNQGEASEVLSILRLIAYNFLRLLRCRVLRSEQNRLVPWRRLQTWVRDALVLPHVWEPDGVG